MDFWENIHGNRRPNLYEQKRMWEEMTFKSIDDISQEFINYIELLKKIYINGDFYYGVFQYQENPVFEWFINQHKIGVIFFYNFFRSKDFRKKFPTLIIRKEYVEPSDNDEFDSNILIGDQNIFMDGDKKIDLIFTKYNSLLLDGYFALLLNNGGIYEKFKFNDPNRAKIIGQSLLKNLFDERYNDIIFFHSTQSWAICHYEEPFPNHTLIIIDKKNRMIWFLNISEVD